MEYKNYFLNELYVCTGDKEIIDWCKKLNINFIKSNFTGHILPKTFQEEFFRIFEKKFINKQSNLRK